MVSSEEVLNRYPNNLLKQISLTNPIAFAHRYLSKLVDQESPKFHFEMFDIALNNDRVLYLAPRDHAKSTLFTFIYPLYRICMDRNIRISLISDTHRQAQKHVRAIRYELANNEKLIDDFGEFRGKNWQTSEFTVKREKNLKDPTVTGSGLGSSKLGNRADLIICDDIIDRDSCYTEHRREQASRWFFEVLTNFLEDEGGQIIVIGTRQHEADLYNELMDNSRYVSKSYKAIMDSEEEKVLWPEKWSYRKLMERKKEIGNVAFTRQFQNEIKSRGSSMFPMELIEPALDREGEMLNPYGERPYWLNEYDIYMGADLASSARVGADYVVYISIGVDEKGNRKLFHIWREKGVPFTKQIDKMMDLHEFFDYNRIVIESNQYQQVLPDTLKQETDMPVASYQTGSEKHSEDKGVPSLRILFENGKYTIPYGRRCREKVDVLVDELRGMAWDRGRVVSTSEHKDMVMGLWLAELGIEERPVGNRFSIIRSW